MTFLAMSLARSLVVALTLVLEELALVVELPMREREAARELGERGPRRAQTCNVRSKFHLRSLALADVMLYISTEKRLAIHARDKVSLLVKRSISSAADVRGLASLPNFCRLPWVVCKRNKCAQNARDPE
mmetsp:Transcript_1471/g.3475  ORF Transcript_1471/g.3475 Transcript_1471/m.3475 type:complete len:130 (+) Transcript_1471:536-925(+)